MPRPRRSDPESLFPFTEPPTKWKPEWSRDPGARWNARREAWGRTRLQRQAGYVRWLRSLYPEGEVVLVGWDAILNWLHVHHVHNDHGRPVTVAVARRWVRERGMPVLHGIRSFPGRTRSSPPVASSYLLLAWLISLFCSGERGPRIALPAAGETAADSHLAGTSRDDAAAPPEASEPANSTG